jgi:isoleucyl-tRNA synthetase
MAKMTPAEAAALAATILTEGSTQRASITISRADVEIELVAKEGFAAASDRVGVIVLDTKLDPELLELGMVREVLSLVQGARKDLELGYADRIRLTIDTEARLGELLRRHANHIAGEVLATDVAFGSIAGDGHLVTSSIDGVALKLRIEPA